MIGSGNAPCHSMHRPGSRRRVYRGVGSAEMGQPESFGQRVTEHKACGWIYRFRANPGRPWGGFVPPSPVLAPGSALGSRPRVALSSAQVFSVYPGARRPCKSLPLGPGSPLGVGRHPFRPSCGLGRLDPIGQRLHGPGTHHRHRHLDRLRSAHELGDEPLSLRQARWCLDAVALGFHGRKPPPSQDGDWNVRDNNFDLSYKRYENKAREAPGAGLPAVLPDDPWTLASLRRALDPRLHRGCGPRLSAFPGDDQPARAFEDAAGAGTRLGALGQETTSTRTARGLEPSAGPSSTAARHTRRFGPQAALPRLTCVSANSLFSFRYRTWARRSSRFLFDPVPRNQVLPRGRSSQGRSFTTMSLGLAVVSERPHGQSG